MLAIRKARTTSATASAMQTTSTAALSRLPAGSEAFLAATGAAAGLRMFTPSPSGGDSKGPGIAEALPLARNSRLFQRVVDRGELRVQVGAEAVDHSDDCERDAGRNQAVFDGGCSGFDIQETATSLDI